MRIIIAFYRLLLKLRYKVVISNSEVICSNSPKLFLSNHQAIVDPQIIFTQLSKYTTIVPIATESYFKIPVIKQILKMLKTIPVSDLTSGNRDTKVLKTIKDGIFNAFMNNNSVLLYPSGQLTDDGLEKIKNKKSAYVVVSELPDDVQIIAIQISGLWGSMWSKSKNGRSPDFFKTFFRGIFIVFANFIFFVPKRTVNIKLIDITEDAKQIAKTGKDEFNSFLEEIYNKNEQEIANKVSYCFF